MGKYWVRRGIIKGVHIVPMSGLASLTVSGQEVLCENPHAFRAFDDCYGDVVDGFSVDHSKLVGKDIVYSTDEFNVLAGFTPSERWDEKWPSFHVEVGEEKEVEV